jgi:hypothetical protein
LTFTGVMSSQAERGRRGAGVNRSGATDTTMLIWKTINANPGITREEIFAKVEHEIPPGWARRRYINHYKISGDRGSSPLILERSRRYVLRDTLGQLRRDGNVSRDGSGRLFVLREIRRYNGNPDHVDHASQAAADHLNRAYAERTLRAAVTRTANSLNARLTIKETEALRLLYGAQTGEAND